MSYDLASGMDRRQFIKVGIAAGAGVLVATALPATLNGLIDHAPNFTPAADLDHDQLSSLAGDTITIANPTGPASALMVERVTASKPYAATSDGRPIGDSFSIFFEGPAGKPLDQDTYELQHPSLGAFPMFLSPVDLTDGATQRYEAVFNRLR